MKIGNATNIESYYSKIVTWTLVLGPILRNYGWGRYDFSFILTVLLAFIYLAKYGFRNRMPLMLAVYLCYCYISVFINATSISSLIELSIIKVFFSYLMFFDVVRLSYLVKVIKSCALVFVCFFFIQEISYYVIGQRISGMFSFLPINLGLEGSDLAEYYEYVVTSERSASFFSEPSHFAQYILLALCIELFYEKKSDYVKSVFYILALVLTQSGTAVLGLAVVFICYLTLSVKSKNSHNKFIAFFVIIFAVLGVDYFQSTTMGRNLMDRQDQLSSTDYGSALSGFRRIYRGYYIYAEYDITEALTGIYNGEKVQEKIRMSSVADTFVSKDDQYFNMVHNILIRTGLIGAFICVLLLLKLWKNNSFVGHSILAVYVSLCFIEALFFKELTALYLVIIYKMLLDNSKRANNKVLHYV